MKDLNLAFLGLCLATPLLAQEIRTSGHFDLSITYEPDNGGWETGIFDYGSNSFLEEDALIFEAGDASKSVIPDGQPWDKIGEAGDPVWIFPEIFEVGQVYLGFGTQNMPRGVFTGGLSNRGRIEIRLLSVTGSGADAGGTMTMWQADFPPLVHYATGDGIGPEDALLDVPGGTHSHYNWAFSKPGDYIVTFEVSGELTETYGGGLTSTTSSYRFRVPGGDGLPGFLSGIDVDNGWRFRADFGYFKAASHPWIYHNDHGWWYVSNADADSAFVWDLELGWLWTSKSTYPMLYSVNRSAWLFFSGPTSNGKRWFNEPGDGWIVIPRSE